MGTIDVSAYGYVSEEELQRFEAQIGHTLPEDYRRFLAATNGFSTPYQVRIGDPEGSVLEEGLWGIRPEDPITDIRVRNMWISHSVAPGYLAIASYIGGFIVLTLSGRFRGMISQLSELDMGFEPPADSPYATAAEYYCEETLYPEADTFMEFLESLMPDPDND